MKTISNPAGGRRLQKIARGLALGVLLITVAAASAHAVDQRGHGRPTGGDRDWRQHEGRRHGYSEPGVVYAPPVVYTPPQYEEPGFNLIVPLNFR
jgi:hypothetical protein